MEIKIAIPDTEFTKTLISNYDAVKDKYNLKLNVLSEEKCLELIVANRIQATVLTPSTYGSALGRADLRIIPGPSISAKGFTGLASVYFKENAEMIKRIATESQDNFLIRLGLILLKERFDISADLIEIKDLSIESLTLFDAIITIKKMAGITSTLDVTDEWFDVYENQLPVAFWVCRAEEHPDNIAEIISKLIAKDNMSDEHIHEHSDEKDYLERDGSILWNWTEDSEKSLEQCLQLLYYHQVFNDIPAVKILGKDIIENSNLKIKIDACEI